MPILSRVTSRVSSSLSGLNSLPGVARLSPSSARVHTPEELAGFLVAQRLAYSCALEVASMLKPGWTEVETSALMDEYLRDHGVKAFFHRSFAWFGDRSRFNGFTKYRHFLPTARSLQETDVVILDTAPVVITDGVGYGADIGYTTSLLPNLELDAAKRKLLEYREKIRAWFASDMTAKEIWERVDSDLVMSGYDNAHAEYPFSVLGHRVHAMPLPRVPGVLIPFGWHAYWSLASRGLFGQLLSPDHVGSKLGLWAIEPHLGKRGKNPGDDGFGAKFEEILVVEPGRAYWLDDHPPHVPSS